VGGAGATAGLPCEERVSVFAAPQSARIRGPTVPSVSE
jgi:hypothetical protein